LVRTIGPVFFVLSTTSIVFQIWLASSELPQKINPYRLYAVSNLGSFVGLLSYPFLFEAFLNLDEQLDIWRLLYFILVVLHYFALRALKVNAKEEINLDAGETISLRKKIVWFLLGTSSVCLFLAVTNIITYEIAPMPLLWILPLGIYLLSFALIFKNKPFCPAWIKDKFYIVLCYSIILFFFTQKNFIPFVLTLLCHLVLLFALCMFCQNELNQRKPLTSRNLTIFFVIIATGGCVGSFLVSWIVPLFSTIPIEYLIGLFVISLALALDTKETKMDGYGIRLTHYLVVLIILWPRVFKSYNIFGIIMLCMAIQAIFKVLRSRTVLLSCGLAAILLISPFTENRWANRDYVYKHRNYYGIYEIYDENHVRFLLNGNTLHGAQYLNRAKRKRPLMYYHYSTPVGKVITSHFFKFERIGLIGLGAGTLAAYGKKDQLMNFYELDPDVFYIATKYFTYYNDSLSKLNCIIGDARISLNKSKKPYGLLAVDAFSGDSVPVHLLTVEAISEYLTHLTKNGIILFHTSNRYLNLDPILFRNAKFLGLYVCFGSNKGVDEEMSYSSQWVAMTPDLETFKKLRQLKFKPSINFKRKIPVWTDKYSNLASVVTFENLASDIKEFTPFDWSFDLGI
jgi:spermidine synthase